MKPEDANHDLPRVPRTLVCGIFQIRKEPPMATPAQIAANRANSQKSTGPKTEAGKAKSARNHLSNGFSSNATLIPGEDPEEFKALMVALALEHEPVTETEQILVEKMVVSQWLGMRAFRLQTE